MLSIGCPIPIKSTGYADYETVLGVSAPIQLDTPGQVQCGLGPMACANSRMSEILIIVGSFIIRGFQGNTSQFHMQKTNLCRLGDQSHAN